MKLIYVHHAERDFSKGQNQKNPITKEGKKEATYFGKKLKKLKISAIYCGTFLRYVQTTKLLNKYIKVSVYSDERLNEWDFKTEPKENFINRHHLLIDEVIQKYSNEDNILFVTSGMNLMAFVEYFYKGKDTIKTDYVQAAGLCPTIFGFNK